MIPNEEFLPGLRETFSQIPAVPSGIWIAREFLAQARGRVEQNYVFEFAAAGHVEQ
jgi:hypothetical protein